MGAGVGIAAVALIDAVNGGELLGGQAALLLRGIAVLMLAAGLLAAIGPARKSLRIEPIPAVREE